MALLLGGVAKGDQVSRAQVHEVGQVCNSQNGNFKPVKLLILHDPRVDYSE